MKKVFILVLVVIMLFSMSGCITVVDGISKEEYAALREKYDDLQKAYDEVVLERDSLLGETDANEESNSCKHLSFESNIKDATCVADGVETFSCLLCGYSYTKKIEATGKHDYKCTMTENAACETDGKKTYVCNDCGESYTEKIIGVHNWISATCTTAKTCSVCQKSEGEPLGHQKEKSKCIRCGILMTSMLYEDENIKVTYHKVEKAIAFDNAVAVFMYIENKTDETLIIQADAFSLNGYSFSTLVMSDYILGNTIGKASITILDFDFDIVDINNIVSIGGQLNVFEEADESIERKNTAVFNNIQIG